MNVPRFFSALVLVAVSASILWGGKVVVSAEPLPMEQMVIVVADLGALQESEQGPELVRSIVGLITTLQDDLPIAFVSDDQPSNLIGPIRANLPDINVLQNKIENRLTSTDVTSINGLEDTLLETHTLLDYHRAAAGSTLYVVTGESVNTDFEYLFSRGGLLGDLYANKGWIISGLYLPGSSPEVVKFLESLSTPTGGWVAELSVEEGFKKLTDSMMKEGTKGSLNLVADRHLEPRDLMSETVSIVPGTRETTFVLLRENPYGSVRLNNPSGLEVSAGDRSSSHVMETPKVVIWKLTDPVPGDWMIEARQSDGRITAWEYSSTGYTIILRSPGTVPLSRTVPITAFVRADGEKVVLSSVRIFATVSGPEGTSWVQEMMDDGTQGDPSESDGYFTALIPPLSVRGTYAVDLELRWTEYDHQISSRANFEAKAYPSLEIRPVQLNEIAIGEKTKVMEVAVHVEGQPYPIDADALTAHWNSSGDQKALFEFEPLRVFVDGPAWEYEVYLTAEEESHHSVLFNITMDYAGSPYSFSSMTISLATMAAPEEQEPIIAPPVVFPPLATQNDPPTAPETTLVTPKATVVIAEPSTPSTQMWTIIAVTALILSIVGLYRFTRTSPYGYLYDDQQDRLVDFSKVKRHPILALLFKNAVYGKDLNIPGLEGVSFHFNKGQVRIRTLNQEQPTIRVNNNPLVDQATIEHKAWVGTRGKLYSFMLSPISPA